MPGLGFLLKKSFYDAKMKDLYKHGDYIPA
jgi:hypothetical protein